MESKIRITRGRIIAISILLVLVIALSIVSGITLYTENELNELQQTALQELEENSGEYDEQTIVLYDTSVSEAKMLAEKFNAALRITSDGKFATLTLSDGTTVADVYSARANRKYLSGFSLDYYAKTSETEERLTSTPNYTVSDTYYGYQSYINYLNIGDAWTTTRGSSITVAVIDTGIDTDHSEFTGKISEYSYNATEDKIVKDYTDGNGDYDWSLIEDEQGHGTSVAGVIAASMDGSGTVGIAPEVNLIIIKAECDANGSFTNTSDLVFGLYYAIEMDVDVVNMSFGTYSGNPFASATKLAVDSDIICVAAAGNDATTSLCYPAADENVIGVGALAENSWELASYSNYGENSDIVAPGTTYTTKMGGGYGISTGTSLASPVVVGAIALYLSQNKYSEFSDVVENLYASCYDLGSLGDDWEYGYGALDINALVCEQRGTVTFDMLTDELDDIEQIFVVNHTLQNLPEPERTYAVFDGWYYDIECTEELNWYADVFTSDLALYAKWVNEDDGIPYTYVTLDDGTIEIRSYTGKRRYITIPDTIEGKVVSGIGDEAFSGQTRLRQVNLPSGLTNIGRNAFYNCNNLLEIEIPEGVTTIGEKAFYNNVRLSSVAFTSNSKLTAVGDYAFAYSGLTRFELPTNLSSINGSAFYGDTSLKAITVASGNTYFSADGGVLFNYTKSTIVAYPAGLSGNSYTVPESVRTIDSVAFAYAKIKGIDLANVTAIGDSAFSYSSLESLTISDYVTSLGSSAFAANFYLKTVTLGAGLTSIPDYCFCSCSMLTSIEIPAGIISIGGVAFAYTGLTQVTFASGSNLLYIGSYAFYYTPVTEIAIPASVISIGAYAFACDYYLSSVTFESGSNLQVIGGLAFYRNYSLTAISLPENLQTIGSYAFMESGLKTVTLPASLTSLGAGAFASCHSLTAINVESANTVYTSIDGVVYTIDKTVIAAYPAGNSATTYTIESTVTTVGEAAFYGSWNLVTVNLPSALVTISDYGFYDCENITVYNTSPEGLVEIGDYAFGYNLSLTSLAMPDSLYQIGKYTFYQDYALTSVTFTENSTLPRISYGAFAYCGLTSFRVPASVSTMAQGAFQGCDYLTSITFAANSKLSSISAYTFDGCGNLQTITFESGSALTSIQAHGFEGMTKLVSVDFGDAKLTNIDNYAFRYCESLTTVTIPEGVTYIGRYAFYGCKSLVSLTLPSTIDYIGRYAFYAYGGVETNIYFTAEDLPVNLQENWDYGIGSYYVGVTDVTTSGDWSYAVLTSGNISIIKYAGEETAIDLTAVNLGGDIVSIGGYAFYNTNITSITLPQTLTSIQRYAFARSKITEITIPDSVTFIGQYAFFYTPINSVTLGANLKTIEQYAFYYTKSLTSVTLPASLTSLGSYAFYYSGITQVNFAEGITITEIPAYAFADSGLTSVTLPDSVTYINDNAFRNCADLTSLTFGAGEDIEIHSNAFYNTGLTYLYIPANVRYIGEYAFVGLTSLTEFEVSEDNKNYSSYEGLLYNKDQSKLIAVPAAKSGTIYLPKSIESIGFGAFENTAAEAVVFDDESNLLAIGYRAFYNAQNLTSVYIPASVVTIDFYAFAMCSNLNTVTFAEGSKLTGVYEGAFYGCISLENIVLPDSIIEISDYAFYGCSSLKEIPVTETSGLKGIYDYAFAYSGITELNLPETLIDIGDYAFRGTKLTSVYISDANATQLIIGLGAFADCGELTEITLPFIGASFEDDEITWFGYIFGAGAYTANSTYVPESLKTVTITEGITFVGKYAFYNLASLEYINVPYSVTKINYYAFTGTTAIYELINTISYDYIGCNTIFGYGLTGTLVISEEVKYIDGYTFSGMTEPLKVVLPYGLTSLNDYAFAGCYGLTELTIPETVTYVGERCFASCQNLNVIYNYSSSPLDFSSTYRNDLKIIDKTGNSTFIFSTDTETYYETEDGFRFKYCNGEYYFVAYAGDKSNVILPEYVNNSSYYIQTLYGLKNVTIPVSIKGYYTIGVGYGTYDLKSVIFSEGITSIGDNLFSSCNGLTYVEIPNTVTSIKFGAFQNCSGLVSIELPNSLTSLGDYAFQGCRSLSSIEIPSSLKYIGSGTFANCASLTTVVLPDSVTGLGSGIFAGCTSLQTIYVGSGLQSIAGMLSEFLSYSVSPEIIISADNPYMKTDGDFIFSKDGTSLIYCLNRDIVSYTVPSGVTELADGVFSGCQYLEEITLNSGLKRIGDYAFSGCYSLKSVVVPDSVTEIGQYAFAFCYELETAVLSQNISSIPDYIFYECYKLSSVTMPKYAEGVLGGSMFMSCRCLTELVIPSGITTIDFMGFGGCGITKLVIPATVTSIVYEYSACSLPNLQSIEVEEENKNYYVEDNCLFEVGSDVLILGCANSVIPSHTKEIANYAFMGNAYLTEIVIPEGVEVIGNYAFSASGLIQITLPSTLKTIGNLALNCSRLYEIYNYSGIDLVNSGVLNTNYIYQITIHTQTEDSIYVFVGETYAFKYENGEYTMVKFVTDSENIVFPGEELYQYGINSYKIGEGLFQYNTKIKSVTFSESVTAIGTQAFLRCVSLSDIVFSKSITIIREYAFSYCYLLTKVDMSPILTCDLYFELFYDCSKLQTIIMPQSVTSLHRDAFKYTAYFNDNKNWEDGGLYCGSYLLYVENDVTTFTVKEGTKCIAYNAFDGCYSLTQVTIGGSHSGLLSSLTNLETLIINEMPSYVADYFNWSIPITLKNVVIKNAAEVKSSTVFSGITGVTIFVEREEVNIIWNEFYPGWNNGNTVVYGGKFITAEFYNSDGTLISSEIFKTSQVIRQPYVSNYVSGAYRYTFIGWDTNGDGSADFIPATLTSNITAIALFSVELRCVTEGHSWNNGEVTTEATCTTDGVMTYTCTVCGETYTEVIPATGHTASEAVKENEVAATCTTDGSYDLVVYCSVCGEEISRETVTIPATGHTASEAVKENEVAATCTTDGSYDLVVYCSICGAEISRETIIIPATGHKYESVVTDPTCTEQGYTTHICATCGDSYTDNETEALGHSWNEGEVTKEATCTTDGVMTYTCTVCGETYTEVISATGHTASEAVKENEVAATCTTDGSYDLVVYCSVCGEELSRETVIVPATGHSYGTPTWNWAEDYSSAIAVFTCTSCGDKREVTATVTSEITKEATTSENGVKTYTATVTFEGVTYTSTKTEEIEKLKAGSGCGTISGADGGSGNLLMIAFTTLTLFAVYTISRRRKNKAQ